MARRRQKILLPWEEETRRGFLKKGLVGGVLLVIGGASWLGTRPTRGMPAGGPLRVLTPSEAAVVLAVADRLIPPRTGFPRPLEVDVPRKVDELVAAAHPATRRDVKRLIRLFENALTGLVFERQVRTFTASPPDEQDARLASWAHSRMALRRTGFRALKRLVCAVYYASPETHAALGYPKPAAPSRPTAQQERAPAAPAPEPRSLRMRPPRALAPKPLDVVPEPRGGIALPEPKR